MADVDIDTFVAAMHPTVVGLLLRRAATIFLALALGAAGWAECAGWAPTPEARMACCSARGACPMHAGSERGSQAQRVVTQAQADSCCAASAQRESTPTAPAFCISLAAALVGPLPAIEPVVALSADVGYWREHIPLPGNRAPTHLLLSVFLI